MKDGTLLRALFRAHLWVSARLLPLQLRGKDFEAVLGHAPLAAPTPYTGLSTAYIIARINRTVRHPWFMRDRRCLREGLLGHRFLTLAGLDPELRFGVDPVSMQAPRIAAHCWLCLDGRPVISDSLPGMVQIYNHHNVPTAGAA